ncbi:MAG: tellurium resistance protein TerC [Bacteroidota bacterium]
MESTLIQDLGTLVMLVLLQAVLGFDNLLYISLESKNAPEDKRAYVRRVGIGLAIILRIVLLVVLLQLIKIFQKVLFLVDLGKLFQGEFNGHSLIVLAGGGFIIYTAIKEIWHMIAFEEESEADKKGRQKSTGQVITMIVIMNLVFSFDSILSAIALTDVIWVMALAIVIGGLLMILLADKISDFLAKNRMYEVLGLFILFLVGIMLVTEGGHLAHIKIMGTPVEQMSKSTFYFVLIILILTDIAQGRYQKNLVRKQNQTKKIVEAAKEKS